VNISSSDTNQHYVFSDFDRSNVLWMRMDDVNASGSPTDLSSWSNNGSKVGDAVQTDAGKFGKGFSFNGAGGYILTIPGTIKNNFSISIWAKPASFTSNTNAFIWTRTPSEYGFDMKFNTAGGIHGDIGNGASWLSTGVDSTGFAGVVGNWYHFVFVFNQTSASIYINNSLNRVVTWTSNSPLFSDATHQLIIGGGNEYFNGTLDDLIVFNRSLSASEISALYNASANQYYNNFTNLAQGTHTITGYAVDSAGNRNNTETRTITINSVVPTINITYPTNTTYLNYVTYLNYTSSGASSCWYGNGSINSTSVTAGTNWTGLSGNSTKGSNTWTLYCNNSANAINSTSVTFTVDNTNPTLNVYSPVNTSNYNSSSVFINVSSSEEGTGMIVPNLDNSLVSWWRMDDVNASGSPSDYLGVNNGTAFGDAIQTDAGKFGKGFNFDGSGDYINVSSNTGNLGITGNITISTWIYANYAKKSQNIINKYQANSPWKGYSIALGQQASDTGKFDYWDGTAWRTSNYIVPDKTWTHLVVTQNITNITFYVNGAPVSSITGAALSIATTEPFLIGCNAGGNPYFNGSIDEVMIFNRSLSASEITSLYNATKLQYTQAGLAEGSHSYKAYTQDLAANLVSSTSNFLVDTINPNINFTGPTPSTGTQSSTSIYVNISSSDTNQHYVFSDFDRSNVLWMRMDDVNASGSPTDLSSWSNNGSKVGDAIQTDSGKFGKGFSFDGAGDYVSAGSLNSDAFTFSAWFRFNGWGTIFGLKNVSNQPEITVWSNSLPIIYLSGNCYRYLSGIAFDNNWHYIAVIINQSNKVDCNAIFANSYYSLDGNYVSLASGNNGTPVSYFTGNYYLGGFAGTRYFNGSIDDVLIFNRTLSQQEISALYNASANQYYNNFTNLAQGTHTITGYAVDSAGNRNQTETRNVTVETGSNVTLCRVLDQANTVYTLTRSISVNGTCFIISANNITLNMNGFNITGNITSGYGVIMENYSSMTLKNSKIYSFDYGIYLNTSSDSVLDNITINNTDEGIYLSSGSKNNILSNIITNNNYYGITLSSSSNNTFTNITAQSDIMGGIYLYNSLNNNLMNLTTSNNHQGIYLYKSSNNTLTNILANNNSDGIYFASSSNNLLINLTSNDNFKGVYLYFSPNNQFTSITINNNSYGIHLYSNSSNIFKNGNVSSSTDYDIYLASTSVNNTFLNMSYNLSRENVDPGSQLVRKWYYSTYVNDTLGAMISGANITAYNVTGVYQFNLTTGSDGYTLQTPIIDYVNNGTRSYYSNYNISATNASYLTVSHGLNITLLQNYHDVFTLDNSAPSISMVYPTNTTYSNYVTSMNYTSSDSNLQACWFSWNNGITNMTMTCGTNLTGLNGNSSLGSNTWKVWANDSSGNVNSSSVTFTVDNVIPAVNFTGPTPSTGTTQSSTSIYVNISSNDTNQHYVFSDFDRSNVLWMRMDDVNASGSPTDLSSWSNNGSKAGDAIQTDSGKFGKGFAFDGDGDYISLPDNLAPKNFSISLWAKTNYNIYPSVIFNTNCGNNLEISLEGTYSKFRISNGTNINIITGNSISMVGWHYYTITYNGTAMAVYLDGTYQIKTDITNAYAISGPNYIGSGCGSSRFFNGSIDEVLIFNRSLSQSEISALYNASVNQYYNNFTNLGGGNHTFKGYAVDSAGNRNNTETRTINVNRAPSVTLLSPANGNITTNRMPTFTWSGSDPDGDSLVYDINLSCYDSNGNSVISSGSDYQSGIGVTSYTPSSYLKCLNDNGQYYGWTVRAYDQLAYSDWAASRNISINSLIVVSLPVSSVNFSSMNNFESKNTSTGDPAPFILSNDGNAELNISVNFTDLFSSVQNPSNNYQYKIRNNSLGCYIDSGTQTSWAQAPSMTGFAINRLNFTSGYQSGCNNVSVDLLVTIPGQEPAGNKSSITTFISGLGEPKLT
jgi:parallel beta-helix repeat protein